MTAGAACLLGSLYEAARTRSLLQGLFVFLVSVLVIPADIVLWMTMTTRGAMATFVPYIMLAGAFALFGLQASIARERIRTSTDN